MLCFGLEEFMNRTNKKYGGSNNKIVLIRAHGNTRTCDHWRAYGTTPMADHEQSI